MQIDLVQGNSVYLTPVYLSIITGKVFNLRCKLIYYRQHNRSVYWRIAALHSMQAGHARPA